MGKQDELNNVIDLFTNHFITYLNYPPLASKIYSILLISHREKGLSFKDIIEQTNSSKSSVSISLNFLKEAQKITFYTEGSSRKKIFTAVSLADVISSYLRIFNSEKKATQALDAYAKKYDVDNYKKFKGKFFSLYLQHIQKVENLLMQTEEDFENLYKEFGRSRRK